MAVLALEELAVWQGKTAHKQWSYTLNIRNAGAQEREINQSHVAWKGRPRERMSSPAFGEFKQRLEDDDQMSRRDSRVEQKGIIGDG